MGPTTPIGAGEGGSATTTSDTAQLVDNEEASTSSQVNLGKTVHFEVRKVICYRKILIRLLRSRVQ